MKALGELVECRFCLSVFHSYDGTEDAGEASDLATQWAREKAAEKSSIDSHSKVAGLENVEYENGTDANSALGSNRPR